MARSIIGNSFSSCITKFLQHFDLPSICWSSLPAAAGLALCVVAVETFRIGTSRHWEDEWELAEGPDLSSHRQKPLLIKGVFLILGGWEEWELISMFCLRAPARARAHVRIETSSQTSPKLPNVCRSNA